VCVCVGKCMSVWCRLSCIIVYLGVGVEGGGGGEICRSKCVLRKVVYRLTEWEGSVQLTSSLR
jgi:hypothetical protein